MKSKYPASHRIILLSALVAICLASPFSMSATDSTDGLSMDQNVRNFIEAILSPDQLDTTYRFLTGPYKWGSLGPGAPVGPPLPDLRKPEQTIKLEIPSDAKGSGTAEDPYVDVLSNYLQQFYFERAPIEGYQSFPDPQEIEQYMHTVAHQPMRVIVPQGVYLETLKLIVSPYTRWPDFYVALDVPPGIWLEAGEGAVLRTQLDEMNHATLVNLNIRSGLIGFFIDGSSLPGFNVENSSSVSAITAAHEAVIIDNRIRDFTHHAICALGSRGRAGSGVIVLRNNIQNIGRSGISSQSRWHIQDNEIRWTGLLRPDAGGGDDGIIIRWGTECKILNNLVVMEQKPHGRHAISGQAAQNSLIAGNLSIVDGTLRNNIFLSDASHGNHFVGNLAIGTGRSRSNIHAGVGSNGDGNILEANVSIGNPHGFRVMGGEGKEANVVRNNYAEYWRQMIQRSSNFEESDNEGVHRRVEVPTVDPAEFGFFE